MARTNPLQFLREVQKEAGRVSWPTRRETMVSSAMVFAMVAFAAAFFFLVDQILGYGVRQLLGLGG